MCPYTDTTATIIISSLLPDVEYEFINVQLYDNGVLFTPKPLLHSECSMKLYTCTVWVQQNTQSKSGVLVWCIHGFSMFHALLSFHFNDIENDHLVLNEQINEGIRKRAHGYQRNYQSYEELQCATTTRRKRTWDSQHDFKTLSKKMPKWISNWLRTESSGASNTLFQSVKKRKKKQAWSFLIFFLSIRTLQSLLIPICMIYYNITILLFRLHSTPMRS